VGKLKAAVVLSTGDGVVLQVAVVVVVAVVCVQYELPSLGINVITAVCNAIWLG
jgi:hypothetical protein